MMKLTMSIYSQLKKLDLVTWPTLLVGFENQFVSKEDIADYAISLLEKSSDCGANVALLACASDYDIWEIDDMLKKQIVLEDLVKEVEMDKLKLAALLSLKESTLSEKEKCDKLQEIYSIFNYPDDMAECSIYSNSSTSPLQAMHNLIIALRKKYAIL